MCTTVLQAWTTREYNTAQLDGRTSHLISRSLTDFKSRSKHSDCYHERMADILSVLIENAVESHSHIYHLVNVFLCYLHFCHILPSF